ncbi:MAG: asparagine synthase-related protein, partial [Candidatus Nanohaloarchaea archaeon]
MNVLAGIDGGSAAELDRMVDALEDRAGHALNVYRDGDIGLVSSRDGIDQGRVKVAFNGYLLGEEERPEEYIARRYEEDGIGFVEQLNGSFRFALYDGEEDRLYLVTDKVGNKLFYYTEDTDDLKFSSYLVGLLSQPDVDMDVDDRGRDDFLASFQVFHSGGRTLVDGVQKTRPSQIIDVDRGMATETYWDVYNRDTREVSDAAAADDLEQLMRQAVSEMAETLSGTPNILFSGGLDSTFLASIILDEVDELNTYTFGWADEHLVPGRKMAEKLGTNHTEFNRPLDLPDTGDVWRHEEPFFPHLFIQAQKMIQEENMDEIFSGVRSVFPFPVGNQNLRKLERRRYLQPVAAVLRRTGPDSIVEHTKTGEGRAIDALGSKYDSAVVTNSRSMWRKRMAAAAGQSLADSEE